MRRPPYLGSLSSKVLKIAPWLEALRAVQDGATSNTRCRPCRSPRSRSRSPRSASPLGRPPGRVTEHARRLGLTFDRGQWEAPCPACDEGTESPSASRWPVPGSRRNSRRPKTDATSRRESWRQFLHATLIPLGKLFANELRRKLDLPDNFAFDWSGLAASDVQGRTLLRRRD